MHRIIILLVALLWFSVSSAADMLSNDTPVQSFQQADSDKLILAQQQNNPQSNLSSVQQSTPTEQAAIMATPAEPEAENNVAPNPTNEAPTLDQGAALINPNPPEATVGESSADKAATVDSLSSELDQLNQLTLMFEQKNNQRLDSLENKNKSLLNKLEQTNLQIHVITQQLNKLNQQLTNQPQSVVLAAVPPNATPSSSTRWEIFRHWLSVNSYYLLICSALLILLIIFIFMLFYDGNKKRQQPAALVAKPLPPTSPDAEEEYDYLGSAEGIAAKLDLARAYVAMDDREAARDTLRQVLVQGDSQQQQEARELLHTLNLSATE